MLKKTKDHEGIKVTCMLSFMMKSMPSVSPEVPLKMVLEFMIALSTSVRKNLHASARDHNFVQSPGRLEVQIEIRQPDENGRLQIIQIHTNKMKEGSFLAPDVILQELGDKANVSELVKEVAKFDDFMLLDIKDEYSRPSLKPPMHFMILNSMSKLMLTYI
ncbi:hypothetical protein ACET3Z_025717 [Daucus carota]